ncbi:hypothetical protein PENANT_c013G01548 [Penicillium antarcticum]|uniref:F-box domain-containing protein n=1 Tax=Penicillium antarcticum TaxID=416450 RepID=A0A1V6Q4W8_9EURO|nr:uncharacterized protein N7508_004063 [Penicillium antarcticum]KAJ5308684.1 hypothetical protein N7508_004063 [Penicillium antarcticum]OQD84295.1 hypothetical protein PENANT_c013G01548 [Penicillium antarcticum]
MPPECHDLAFLPRDVFWMILAYLEPHDIIRNRRVSRAWREAFSNPSILVPRLRWEFPRTREAKALDNGTADPHRGCQLFDQVAARYDHLERAKPRSIKKYGLCGAFGSSRQREWFPVQPWEYHCSHDTGIVDIQFEEALWSFDGGLLVFPSAESQGLMLLDLETDRQFEVPFTITGRVVRRVRIQKRLLVVEWAEPMAFHWLNDSDGVHRHFASSFDIVQGGKDVWSITQRNEWKIMFLGHPLSERDRFFSTHNNTHYVIYMWQPNRSLYTADEDAPIESLFVWDISQVSSHRPSESSSGVLRGGVPEDAPRIVARFGFRDLDFFCVRQRGTPAISRLSITDDSQAIQIVDNFLHEIEGQGTPDPEAGTGIRLCRTTSIPVIGNGPHNRTLHVDLLPVYRGNCSLQSEFLGYSTTYGNNWTDVIAQVSDPDLELGFCLYFELNDPHHKTIRLGVWAPGSNENRVNVDFTGRAKLCGCDRYLVGENTSRELVIYRFDR